MDKWIKIVLKYLVLFLVGFFAYMGIELLYRQYTHWTMGCLGGVCLIILGGINEYFSWEIPFWLQCLKGSIIITVLEFIAGVVLNIWLQLNIWDYSHVWGNVLGQICLPFTIIWFFLSAVAIVFDDWLRYWLFKEEKPHYKWI